MEGGEESFSSLFGVSVFLEGAKDVPAKTTISRVLYGIKTKNKDTSHKHAKSGTSNRKFGINVLAFMHNPLKAENRNGEN